MTAPDELDRIDPLIADILDNLPEDERERWRPLLRIAFMDYQEQDLAVTDAQRHSLAVILRTVEKPERDLLCDWLLNLLQLGDIVRTQHDLLSAFRRSGKVGPQNLRAHEIIRQFADELSDQQIANKLNADPMVKRPKKKDGTEGEWTRVLVKRHRQHHHIEKAEKNAAEKLAEMEERLIKHVWEEW